MSSSLGVRMTSLFSTLLILRHLTAATVKVVLIQKKPWRWKCLTASLSYPNEKSGYLPSPSFLSTPVHTSFSLTFIFFVIGPWKFYSLNISFPLLLKIQIQLSTRQQQEKVWIAWYKRWNEIISFHIFLKEERLKKRGEGKF